MLRTRDLVARLVVALLVTPAVVMAGQATIGQVTPGRRVLSATRPAGATVVGSIWNVKDEGVPDAHVRLRNLGDGRIVAAGMSDRKGQCTFEGLDGGNYVLELVDDEGRVLAVGHSFTAQPGETIATFIRLGAKLPVFARFFGNAAAAAASIAASLGVTAVVPAGQPASPQR
jgi:hypothetical protein